MEIHDSAYSMCRGRRKMIRFINLTGQILIDESDPNWLRSQPEPHFAWFDTVKNEFMIFNGKQEWNFWEAFEQDLRIYLSTHRSSLHIPEVIQNDDEFYEERENGIVSQFKRLYQFKNYPTTTKVTKTADPVKGISSTTVTDEFYGEKKT